MVKEETLPKRTKWRILLGSPLGWGAAIAALVAAFLIVPHGMHSRIVNSEEDTDMTAPATSARRVFDSPLAGQWYPADKATLESEIDGYLKRVETPAMDAVMGLILPHAGYRYSGPVAAYGAKQVQGKAFERVIVMGPSHRMPMENCASVPEYTAYTTPLGEVALDTAFIQALKEHPEFRTIRGAHEGEHSVQIEVPLLQRVLGGFKLVPIVIGQLNEETTRRMGAVLAGLIGPETLVVASSDFTHYGPNYRYLPFRNDIPENLERLDMDAWNCIKDKDLGAFYGYIEKTGATVCGESPIGVLLSMLPEGATPHLLKYDTSGNITGDWANSVSYLSIAFTGAWPKGEPVEAKASATPTLTEEDKRQLLALARGTLEGAVRNGGMAKPDDFGIQITPGMEQVMGAFVTIKIDGRLRGCIGEIFPRRPLYKAVMENAIRSGLEDPRFEPVSADELPLLDYEISALTPPHEIASYKDIVLGRDGMVIEKQGRSAVFLPQVAPEQGWDLPTTLTHLSQKAGLPPDAWKEGARFTAFQAIVFHE